MSEKITKPPLTDDAGDHRDFLEQIERQLNLVGSRTLDIGSIAAGDTITFTITVMGCRVNRAQSVALAAPSTLNTGLIWSGHVTADNVVTIRVHNTTGGPIDPALATWGARVML